MLPLSLNTLSLSLSLPAAWGKVVAGEEEGKGGCCVDDGIAYRRYLLEIGKIRGRSSNTNQDTGLTGRDRNPHLSLLFGIPAPVKLSVSLPLDASHPGARIYARQPRDSGENSMPLMLALHHRLV